MANLISLCFGGNCSDVPNNLEEFEDIEITNAQDGDILKYDSQSGKWINVPDSGGGSEELAKLIDRSIESIVIPDGVTYIGRAAFKECQLLESVTIPNTVTTLGDEIFSNCELLESVVFPDTITEMGNNTFYFCYGLKSVKLPNAITSIKSNTFYKCSALESLDIPSTVTSIVANAMNGCTSLMNITCRAVTPPTVGNNALLNVPADCNIYVPSASVNTYKGASGWSARSSYIQAIP